MSTTSERLREAALTTGAVLGCACLALVLLGAVLDATLVVFKTGSMSPTMPTGALAVVRQVDALDVGVGDVVTVTREGRLPITHRVVQADPDPAVPGGARLVLRGDANSSVDPTPYDVTRVGRVVWALPHLGTWVENAQRPAVLGAATATVTGLVVLAVWPRREHELAEVAP
ncbi:signal peptidase I [Pseudokineococcus marinus]|uniref:Signal peptidase I n=1 Tax=Pseudokineococcus marinus TaxID=351215 RepID=A0A849BTZ9_9ACTN|nr:signal peptidase I [Pseudokineococcus marinus]NNH23904.1 signal peptidase I [Pseudokineococcus marinus]